jgi:uncharacterized protein YlxW (UPF0749 family)
MTSLLTRVRSLPSWQVTLGVALLALGFLVAAQLRSEGPRVRYTTQERSPLVETALELQADQGDLRTRIGDLDERIRALQMEGEGSAELVRDLNSRLEDARIAAGLVALKGTGIVLQLQDSGVTLPPGANRDDYVVSGRDIRVVMEELWLAGAEAIAVNGERITASSAILDIGGSLLVNSAYLTPPYQIAAIGPPTCSTPVESAGWVDFLRARSEAFGIGVAVAEPASVEVPAYVGGVNLRFRVRCHGSHAVNRLSAQVAIAAVAVILGFLVVLQIRAQGSGNELAARSAQELTLIVANLNERNDQLRTEIATLEGELRELESAKSRGESSLGELGRDLRRLRAWTGQDPVTGPGVRVTVVGPIGGEGVMDLINELRNAGAEAIAIEDVRVVSGTVVAGPEGGISVQDSLLDDPFTIEAIGSPETLTGSLSRAGDRGPAGRHVPRSARHGDAGGALALPATTRTSG